MSSFSTAAWAVGHDLDLSPGQVSSGGSGTGWKRRGPKFFLGGNAKCPRLLEGLFYRTKNDEPYKTEPNVKIKCLRQ